MTVFSRIVKELETCRKLFTVDFRAGMNRLAEITETMEALEKELAKNEEPKPTNKKKTPPKEKAAK